VLKKIAGLGKILLQCKIKMWQEYQDDIAAPVM
jgi:hypothetical protein